MIAIKEISSAARHIEVWVLRNGERLHFTITPTLDEKQGIGFAGWMQETEVQVAGYVAGIDMAEKAGLQKGDILVSVDGRPIRSTSSLHDVISTAEGKSVQLVYARNGVNHTILERERLTLKATTLAQVLKSAG